ncbi:MAG: IPT/TIG domain-containing protein [Chitinophagaceae bacterium]
MKLLFNIKLLCLAGLLISLATFTSCDKDDNDSDSGETVLLSFGPTGAQHGDTLRFFGSNLDKVTEINFTGSKVMKSDFKTQTKELILVVVPDATQQGFVTLKTPAGDIVSITRFNLEVLPVITSLTKESRPGDNITIKGNFLDWITSVTFPADKIVTTFVSKTLTELVVKVPADAKTGKLIITYGGTKSSFYETDSTVKVTLPLVTGMTPNPVVHAANLTITGTNLDLVKKVMFTSVSAAVTTFVSQTATQLVVKVPGSTTKGKITLEAASAIQTVSTTDLDVVLPAITSMAPNPVDPLANLTITGTNLDLVASASFVGVTASVTSFVSQTATQLVVTVPTGSITGKLTLGVKNSTLSVKSGSDLAIVGSSVTPIILYDDALTSAWNGWIGGGWGGTKDLANTTPVQSGSKSCRISYVGDYGVPLQLGGASISLSGYTTLKIAIYGGTGSNGQNVNIGFNEADGKTVTIVEGQWTDFSIPISQISAASTLGFLYLKKYSTNGDFTIYFDNLGLY